MTNEKGVISYVNDNLTSLVDYEQSDMIGRDFFFLHQDVMDPVTLSEIKATTMQGVNWHGEMLIRGANGIKHHLFTSIVPVLDEMGYPYRFISISQNITSQKLVEKELRRTYRLFVKGPIIVLKWKVIPEISIEYVSENISQTSYKAYEVIGDKNFLNIIDEEDQKRVLSEIKAYCQSDADCFEQEFRIVKKDGEIIWVFMFTRIERDNKRRATDLDSYLLDITYRKKSDLLLQQSDKLSLVGELAAGVAHEIRNPLTAIKGFAQLLKTEDMENKTIYLDIILSEIDRIQMILTEFMTLAKPQKKQPFLQKNVIALISDVVNLLTSEAILNRVQIITHFQCQNLHILCDENQIKQAFVNFIKNAIEAMPHGGTLQIYATKVNETHVHLSFTDTGSGIPEQTLKNIGKPFFTTKQNGNGLGLMISFKIIEQHGGKVEIKSKVNQGTTFMIKIPSMG